MVLPLPGFLLHPFTAVGIAVVHIYLGVGHLSQLFAGDLQWTHVWKGFGALIGAYVFAALATRGFVRRTRVDRRSGSEKLQLDPQRAHVGAADVADAGGL